MRLPTQLSRRKKNVHKNTFGHVLVLAGSKRMLGAAALTGLAAMRTGAGLVTTGVPKSLNTTLHKKLSNVIMTLPLAETKEQSVSFTAFKAIKPILNKYTVIALGPGLSQSTSTQKFIFAVIEHSPVPVIIDADALNAVSNNTQILLKAKSHLILTPHPGEMARLTGLTKAAIEKDRKTIAEKFTRKFKCTLLLKGPRTVVASPNKRTYINTTGNSGMATAGSGDVLTGIIAGLGSQGSNPYLAAKYGAYLHGIAGDLAAKSKGRLSMIAADIIDFIPKALK